MKVELKNVRKDNCSCNFCDKGYLNPHRNGLVYPYEKVFVFGRSNGNGLVAHICEDCFRELILKVNKLLTDG